MAACGADSLSTLAHPLSHPVLLNPRARELFCDAACARERITAAGNARAIFSPLLPRIAVCARVYRALSLVRCVSWFLSFHHVPDGTRAYTAVHVYTPACVYVRSVLRVCILFRGARAVRNYAVINETKLLIKIPLFHYK